MNNENDKIRIEKRNCVLQERESMNFKDNMLLLENNFIKKEENTPDEVMKSAMISPAIQIKESEGIVLSSVPPPPLKQNSKFIRTNTMVSNQNREQVNNEPNIKKEIDKLLENNYYVIFMTLVTIYALFGTDISVAFISQELDSTFDYISTAAFILFIIELLLSCYAKKDYIFSFFFWLDLISTISLILEIDFIFSPLLNHLGAGSNLDFSHLNYTFLNTTSSNSNITSLIKSNISSTTTSSSAVSIAQATRASKITRVLRVIRIIRLIRIVKLYKNATIAKKKMEEEKKKKEEFQREQLRKKIISEELSRSVNSVTINTGLKKPKKSILDIINPAKNLIETSRLLVGKIVSSSSNDFIYSKIQDNNRECTDGNKVINEKVEIVNECNNNLDLELIKNLDKNPEIAEKIEEINRQDELSYEKMTEGSKISKTLSESITKKIILLILLMLFILPVIDISFWEDDSTMSYKIIADMIDRFYLNEGGTLSHMTYNRILSEILNYQDSSYPIINITINNNIFYISPEINGKELRKSDVNPVVSTYLGYTLILYSSKEISKSGAIIGIVRSCFVCFIITITAIMLEDSTKKLVLDPLEVMIEIVDTVAKDPMNAKNVENLQTGLKNMVNKLNDGEEIEIKGKKDEKEQLKSGKKKQYEIYVIQSAIIKISALLSIGFGEAGGEVIKENISGNKDLNPMIKGKKKMAIFGFCDIRGFPNVNKALQEKTIIFVNEIAEIVHSCVDKFGGAANKNIGDAFLVVWKFKSKDSGKNKKKNIDEILTFNPNLPENMSVADQALLGFLNIIIKINSAENILAYRNLPQITNSIKRFKVNMGFGLHLGWAIEGSIGSTYKIDASYLSPNVNISARLEGATRQYGVTILISGELYDCLSEELKEICRLIDIVTVKGAKTITRLYTVDVNLELNPRKTSKKELLSMKEKRNKYTEKREEVLLGIQDFGSAGRYALCRNSFIELLDLKRPPEFLPHFNKGFSYYIDGDWEKAKEYFQECLSLDPNDGPTSTLYEYIESHNFIKPKTWEGYRPLASK